MPLRYLLRHLVNNPKLIERLAESYPIRRAAQWTLYLFLKGKDAAEKDAGRKALQFKDKFLQEFKKEMEKSKAKLGKPPDKYNN